MKKRILKLISCVAFAGTLFTSNTLAVFAQTEGTPANTESTPAPAEDQPTAGQPAGGTPASTENTSDAATDDLAKKINDFFKSLNGQKLSVNEVIKKANDVGIPVLLEADYQPSISSIIYKDLTKQQALELVKNRKVTNKHQNFEGTTWGPIFDNRTAGYKHFDVPNQPKIDTSMIQVKKVPFEEIIATFSNGEQLLDEKHNLFIDEYRYITVSKDIPVQVVNDPKFVDDRKYQTGFVVVDNEDITIYTSIDRLTISVSKHYQSYLSTTEYEVPNLDDEYQPNPKSNTVTKVNPKSNSKVKDKVDTSDATLSSALLLLGSAIALVRLNKKK